MTELAKVRSCTPALDFLLSCLLHNLWGPGIMRIRALVHNMNFMMATADHKPGARPFGPHLSLWPHGSHVNEAICVSTACRQLPGDPPLGACRLLLCGCHGFLPSSYLDWATSSVFCSLGHSWFLIVLSQKRRAQRMLSLGPCHPCCPPHQARILSLPTALPLPPTQLTLCKIGSEMPLKGFSVFERKRKTKPFLTTLKTQNFFLCFSGRFCFSGLTSEKHSYTERKCRKEQGNTSKLPYCRHLL